MSGLRYWSKPPRLHYRTCPILWGRPIAPFSRLMPMPRCCSFVGGFWLVVDLLCNLIVVQLSHRIRSKSKQSMAFMRWYGCLVSPHRILEIIEIFACQRSSLRHSMVIECIVILCKGGPTACWSRDCDPRRFTTSQMALDCHKLTP